MSAAVVVHFWHDAEGWLPLLLVGPFSVEPIMAYGSDARAERATRNGGKSSAWLAGSNARDGYLLRESVEDIANLVDARHA